MPKLKLNKELIEKASKLIAAGNYQKDVAKYLGIDESTWYRWLRKGETAKTNNIFCKLYKAVKKAEAEAIARNVALIQQAAQDSWQAAAWWLERRYPEQWGKKDYMNLNADGGFTLKIVEVSNDGKGMEGDK